MIWFSKPLLETNRKFKHPFSLTGAISPNQASRQAHECLMKIAVLLWPIRAMQRSEALDLFPVGALAQIQTERHRRLALATGFGSQAVWNRSSRRAGERGGARPRRHRIQKLSARLRTASLSFLKLERTTACERPNVSAQDLIKPLLSRPTIPEPAPHLSLPLTDQWRFVSVICIRGRRELKWHR